MSVAGDPELVDPSVTSLNYYLPNRNNFGGDGKAIGDGQTLINALGTPLPLTGNFVRLVGGSAAVDGKPASGSVQWPATATSPSQQRFYGAIDLPAMPLPGPSVTGGGSLGVNGRFAYWIGDEGIKAKVNLPDVHATSNTGASLPGLTEWDKGFAGSAAQRSSFESVTPSFSSTAALMPANFDTNYLSLRNLDILATIANPLATWKDLGLTRTRTRSDINTWARNVGGEPAGNAITLANRLLWHEITPWSFSVLSDTLNGGVKTDLSTAFELPYSVFRTLEVFPGQKLNTSAQDDRKPSFFGLFPRGAECDLRRRVRLGPGLQPAQPHGQARQPHRGAQGIPAFAGMGPALPEPDREHRQHHDPHADAQRRRGARATRLRLRSAAVLEILHPEPHRRQRPKRRRRRPERRLHLAHSPRRRDSCGQLDRPHRPWPDLGSLSQPLPDV